MKRIVNGNRNNSKNSWTDNKNADFSQPSKRFLTMVPSLIESDQTVESEEILLTRNDMHQYQKDAVEFLKSKNSSALWVAFGLGKTVITLTALEEMLREGTMGKVLIIAPLRVANILGQKRYASR